VKLVSERRRNESLATAQHEFSMMAGRVVQSAVGPEDFKAGDIK
jgi:hypothetical protein